MEELHHGASTGYVVQIASSDPFDAAGSRVVTKVLEDANATEVVLQNGRDVTMQPGRYVRCVVVEQFFFFFYCM